MLCAYGGYVHNKNTHTHTHTHKRKERKKERNKEEEEEEEAKHKLSHLLVHNNNTHNKILDAKNNHKDQTQKMQITHSQTLTYSLTPPTALASHEKKNHQSTTQKKNLTHFIIIIIIISFHDDAKDI